MASRSDAPVASPRSDWRFLLADPALDRVGYLGSPRGSLLAELRLVCGSVEVLDPHAWLGDGDGGGDRDRTYDLIVASEPSGAALRFAADRVSPGGTLVIEVPGPFGAPKHEKRGKTGRKQSPLRSPGAVTRQLAGLGFEEFRVHWHWPSFDRCKRIIPFDDRTALRYSLSQGSRGARGRFGAWLARRLLGVGLLRWAVTSASVIARRAEREPPALRSGNGPMAVLSRGREEARAPSIVHDFLNRHWDRLGLERHAPSRDLSFVVLTPRFRNSSHLVFLLLPRGGSRPILAAKLPRLAGQTTSIEREAGCLRDIQACRPAGFESIPRLVAFEPCGDRMILLMTGIAGRAMDRATVRKDAARCCEATLDWLMEVQTATRLAPDPVGGGFRSSIERDLAQMEKLFEVEKELLDDTRTLIEPLASAGLSSVLEHRDLSHPNLLLGGRGVRVIDWEQAELRGVPAVDLFFFLTYVAKAVGRTHSDGEALASLDRAFFQRRSWARRYVRRYAQGLGLPRDMLTPLFVACWLRQVAGLAQRVARGADPGTPSAETAVWLHRNWRFAALRHAVERADRLDWDDVPSRGSRIA